MPRDRLGALPFPGLFTLYSSTNPDKLGEHRYEHTPRLIGDESEGIVYTARAGFVDLAHIRITIDTVRFNADRIRKAIRAHQTTVALPTLEGSIFHVTLKQSFESSLVGANAPSPAEQQKIVDEFAIRLGQRVTFLMMTWHEVLTWYGYRTIGWVDESPSAFTWDDTMSHVVGMRVAGRVLRDTTSRLSYDEQVTIALRDELKNLGAESAADTDEAAHAVEGQWWAHGKPLKRQIDIGLVDNVIHPWLVPGFSATYAHPEPFKLPTLNDVCGHDFSNSYSVQIEPRVHIEDDIRQLLPNHPKWFDADKDLRYLIEVMRQQLRTQYAADVDRPWSAPATRASEDSSHLTLVPANSHEGQ